MKIQLITIYPPQDIEANIGLLTRLVLILDQEDFLEHVSELRGYWELTDQLVESENLDKWLNGYHPNFKLTRWAADVYDNASQKINVDSSSNDVHSSQFEQDTMEVAYLLEQKAKEYIYSNPIDIEIAILLKRFSIPEEFRDLIIKSAICGVVNETDYIGIPNGYTKSELGNWFYEDINLDKKISGYKSDTKPDLLRDRDWYRLSHDLGKKPMQIAKEDAHRNTIDLVDYRNRIQQQIKRYKKFLKVGSFRNF